MLQSDFSYGDYKFKSIRSSDVERVVNWIRDNIDEKESYYSLDSDIFYRRFLEYYISENECFMEIYKNNQLVAVFKGRLEKMNHKELVIWFFVMDKLKRNEGIGTSIIDLIIKYFKEVHNIDDILVGVVQNNMEGISFWNSMGFDVSRISRNFFDGYEEKDRNLVIMKK